jgi:hypothetical protein
MKWAIAIALLLLSFASAALADGSGIGVPPLQTSGVTNTTHFTSAL